jgi:isochorismate synthase EntC
MLALHLWPEHSQTVQQHTQAQDTARLNTRASLEQKLSTVVTLREACTTVRIATLFLTVLHRQMLCQQHTVMHQELTQKVRQHRLVCLDRSMSKVLLAQKYLLPIMGKLTIPQFMVEHIQKNTKVFHQQKHCNKIE